MKNKVTFDVDVKGGFALLAALTFCIIFVIISLATNKNF